MKVDVLIIGSGIAAMQFLKNLRSDLHVMIVTKSSLQTSNSYLAQGGIAASIGSEDNPNLHFKDTLEAGRFYNDTLAVRKLVEEAPDIIQDLVKSGCQFDYNAKGQISLGMEGSHSKRRIVHGGGDQTGKIVMNHLFNQNLTHVEIKEHFMVYELAVDHENNRCIGAKAKNENGQILEVSANHVVLATGGCGGIYSYSSNAPTVSGDGIALAYRAGAQITDMEFIQFHPTMFCLDGRVIGLISEAVRGEGAILVTENKERIMEKVHPLKDLAPRHVVSQTIFDHLKNGDKIYLDITAITKFSDRFPTIAEMCKENGIDLKKGLIPVVPGSHFLMGGVKTDLIGKTNIDGLYAIGEVACTGVHGANRLASNSLLEGLAYGKRLAEWINISNDSYSSPAMNRFQDREHKTSFAFSLPESTEIQRMMMQKVGIVRSYDGLMEQKQWLKKWDIEQLCSANLQPLTVKETTKVFMLITSWLITNSSLQREESRGGHFRSDFPFEREEWRTQKIIQQRYREKGKQDEPFKVAAIT
ncbi:L-aspartate oxidase [Bacillaceae bacterium S4-13-58]